jgi:flagellar biosynthesis/type III secretory pathway chaperone
MTTSLGAELAQLLEQELSLSNELKTCLVNETLALSQQNIEQINTLLDQKNRTLQQLQQAANKRQQWLTLNDYVSSYAAVIDLSVNNTALGDQWATLETSIKESQTQNLINGSIIDQSKLRNQQMMKIMGLQSRQSDLYSGSGSSRNNDKGTGYSIAKA